MIQNTAGTPSRSPRPPIIYEAFLCEGLPPVFFPPCSLALPLLSGGGRGPLREGGTPSLMSRLASRGFGCGVAFGIHRETDRPCVPTLRRTRSASVRHPDPRLECQTQQPVWGRRRRKRRRKIPQAFFWCSLPSSLPLDPVPRFINLEPGKY